MRLSEVFRKLGYDIILRINELRLNVHTKPKLAFEPRIRPSEWPDYPGHMTKLAIDQIVQDQTTSYDSAIICTKEKADIGRNLIDAMVQQVKTQGLKWKEPWISMDHEGFLIFEWNIQKQQLIVFAHPSAWYVKHGKDKEWGPVTNFADIWESIHNARAHV